MGYDQYPFFRETGSFLSSFSFLRHRWLSVIGAVLLGVAILVFSFQPGPKASLFAQAENMVARWAASPQDDALFQEMSGLLKKIPPLQQKYEAVIAQKLIEGGKEAEALEMAYRSLRLAFQEAPFHAGYAETSLLIEQESYQTALEKAVALKEKMTRECDIVRFSQDPMAGGALLYAHNLLRIACLQQELNNGPGEKAAWCDVEQFLMLQKADSPLAHCVLSSFREKDIDLSHYIAERKSILSKGRNSSQP